MAVELLTFPGLEAVPVQPELSPVVRHHRDNGFLGIGEDAGASVAIRLPVAATLMEARRMAGRKPTIFEPKLNQPPDEDRFHVTPPDCIIGARDWSVHCVTRGINKSGRPIDSIGVQRVIAGLL